MPAFSGQLLFCLVTRVCARVCTRPEFAHQCTRAPILRTRAHGCLDFAHQCTRMLEIRSGKTQICVQISHGYFQLAREKRVSEKISRYPPILVAWFRCCLLFVYGKVVLKILSLRTDFSWLIKILFLICMKQGSVTKSCSWRYASLSVAWVRGCLWCVWTILGFNSGLTRRF